MGRTIYMELVASSRVAIDLSAGGLMVQDKTLVLHETCEIVVFNDGGQLELPAKAVYVDGNGGVGLEVVGFDATLKAKIAELIEAGVAAAAAGSDVGEAPLDLGIGSDPAIDAGLELADETTELAGGSAAPAEAKAADADDGVDDLEDDADEEKKTLHERLRRLPLIEQVKLARAGDITERMLLERMYGKNVWEPLLRNPRVTAPEVARIARMGALPRPMIELIVGNGAWLQVPEVRRALLSNPRLGTDQIIKLLRLMSKQELKLATMQTAYSMAVRQQAKAMLKAEGG